MSKEKRQALRAPGEKVKVRIYAQEEKPSLGEGLLLDISTRGLCFSSEKLFKLGEEILLEFVLWKKFKFLPVGKIVRIKKENGGYHYGLEFIHTELSEKAKLAKYVYGIKV